MLLSEATCIPLFLKRSTYIEAADVENNHSDLRVDGLVLLVHQRAVVHLEREEAEVKNRAVNFYTSSL